MKMRTALSVASSSALALLLTACSCPFGCGKSGVLQPQMTPDKGTAQAPAAKIGEAPTAPWSKTTVEAAVDNKPNMGKVETVTGEVIDVSCYWQLGKHGAKHKDCAQKCMKSGQPIGLLTDKGDVYLLMAEEHHPRRDGQTASLRDQMIEHASDVVTVTGTCSMVNGQKALFVSGFVSKP